MAERKDKPRPAGEHRGTDDAAEGAAIRPADEPAPELTARGVFYRGTTPGTTEFSGALFDSQGKCSPVPFARPCRLCLTAPNGETAERRPRRAGLGGCL